MLVLSDLNLVSDPTNSQAPFPPVWSESDATQAAKARERSQSSPELVELIAHMAQGQQEALARLYDQTAHILNGLLLRILDFPQDAEEVLLDVYMKAWKNARSYSPERGTVQAWLFTMARSVAIDRVRQRKARPSTLPLEFQLSEPPSDDESPEQQSAASQRRRKVQELINSLPPDQREAVTLAFFGGFTHSELASRLGQPLGTVKSRIRMGLIHLRGLMEESSIV